MAATFFTSLDINCSIPKKSTIICNNNSSKSSEYQTELRTKPKSNKFKTRPSSLSLTRHKRSSYTQNLPIIHFAKKLNSIEINSEEAFLNILDEFPEPHKRDDVVLLLNNMRTWQKSLMLFNWIKKQNLFPLETILYNVLMKSLRFGRRFHLLESLAFEMIENGIVLDNITYSTIITCAKRCNFLDKAVEWFERMNKSGIMPDEVTYSAILDVYANLGNVEEVMILYDIGRASGWKPDYITFGVLGKMFGERGDNDGIQYVFKEMEQIGLEPNLKFYVTIFDALGKAKHPSLARKLFEQMLKSGIEPDEKTLIALCKTYGKARWSEDALELWWRIKSKGWKMDYILYNTLLSMCADLGLEEEADEIFDHMKGSDIVQPDTWSYTAMLNVCASGGNVNKAMTLFDEMTEKGVDLNIMGCTCLIQCLGRAKRMDDLVRVFQLSVQNGVKPDDRLSGCLLSVISYCDDEKEINNVISCLIQYNPKLVTFLNMIDNDETSFDTIIEEFKMILNDTENQARRPYCNCLIDICRNKKLYNRAHELLYMGTMYGLYPGLHTKTTDEWRLNVRTLSVGAAHTAFEEWMGTLTKMIGRDEPLPFMFSVSTGSGKHKFSKGMAVSLGNYMKKFGAPFQQTQAGFFFATREDLESWVESRAQAQALAV